MLLEAFVRETLTAAAPLGDSEKTALIADFQRRCGPQVLASLNAPADRLAASRAARAMQAQSLAPLTLDEIRDSLE